LPPSIYRRPPPPPPREPPPREPAEPREEEPRELEARSKLGLREPLKELLRCPVEADVREEAELEGRALACEPLRELERSRALAPLAPEARLLVEGRVDDEPSPKPRAWSRETRV